MNKNIIFTLLSIGCVETNLKSISDPVSASEPAFEYSVTDYTIETSQSEEIEYEEPEDQIYEQVWNAPLNPKTDFIILVDKSSSMLWEMSIIRARFDYFLENLNNNMSDWRLIFFDTTDGCYFQNEIITPATTETTLSNILDIRLRENGIGGMSERLLTMGMHVFQNTIEGGCNNNLFRSDAMLNVIMFSDEAEQSELPVGDMIEEIIPYTNGVDKFRITTVFDENVSLGRYEEAANYTGGQWFPINDRSSWDSGINLISMSNTGIIHEYQLDYEPVIDTIQVFINNIESNQWTYNVYTQSVIIDNDVLQPNDTIKITFEML